MKKIILLFILTLFSCQKTIEKNQEIKKIDILKFNILEIDIPFNRNFDEVNKTFKIEEKINFKIDNNYSNCLRLSESIKYFDLICELTLCFSKGKLNSVQIQEKVDYLENISDRKKFNRKYILTQNHYFIKALTEKYGDPIKTNSKTFKGHEIKGNLTGDHSFDVVNYKYKWFVKQYQIILSFSDYYNRNKSDNFRQLPDFAIIEYTLKSN